MRDAGSSRGDRARAVRVLDTLGRNKKAFERGDVENAITCWRQRRGDSAWPRTFSFDVADRR
jgi:hypothetical protein